VVALNIEKRNFSVVWCGGVTCCFVPLSCARAIPYRNIHKPFYPGLGVGVERAMSIRTSKPAKPRSRLDEVLAVGVARIGAQRQSDVSAATIKVSSSFFVLPEFDDLPGHDMNERKWTWIHDMNERMFVMIRDCLELSDKETFVYPLRVEPPTVLRIDRATLLSIVQQIESEKVYICDDYTLGTNEIEVVVHKEGSDGIGASFKKEYLLELLKFKHRPAPALSPAVTKAQ
jgi:hypothetical protein